MFERDILASLKQWKNDTHRKPLVLRGARQVGKKKKLKTFLNYPFLSKIYFPLSLLTVERSSKLEIY